MYADSVHRFFKNSAIIYLIVNVHIHDGMERWIYDRQKFVFSSPKFALMRTVHQYIQYVCMYVCMCVCVCMYVCMYVCVYVCMYVCVYVCMYVCM
jgi:hypothetical protein